LKKKLHTIGGNVQGVCQSRLCIFSQISKGSASQDTASFVHDHLHRSLIESNRDKAIVKGVTLITAEAWHDTIDYLVRKIAGRGATVNARETVENQSTTARQRNVQDWLFIEFQLSPIRPAFAVGSVSWSNFASNQQKHFC